MTKLVNQATYAPTRKKLFQDTAALLITAGFWLAAQYGGVAVPPGLEGMTVAVVGGWIGWQVRERA